MIDIHAHILPGFDDGAATMAEAVEMACQARADGIGTIVATPHILDAAKPHREKILAGVRELQARLDEGRIAVRILPGAEIHIGPDVARMAAEGLAMTLCDAGKYLLLELPLNEMPRYTESVVFDLLSYGITPVLAHPERNRDLARDPRLVQSLVDQGCLTQISTGSIRGRFGTEARKAAETLIKRGLAHIMATDGHGSVHRRVMMAEARAKVASEHGQDLALDLTRRVPQAVIEGRVHDPRGARPVRGGWRRLAGLKLAPDTPPR